MRGYTYPHTGDYDSRAFYAIAVAVPAIHGTVAVTQATTVVAAQGAEIFVAAVSIAQAAISTSSSGIEQFNSGVALTQVAYVSATGAVLNPPQPQSYGGTRRAVTWYPQRVRHVGIPSWPTRHGKVSVDQEPTVAAAAGSVRQKFVAVAASRQGTVTGGPRGIAVGTVFDETEEAYLLGLLELEDAAA